MDRGSGSGTGRTESGRSHSIGTLVAESDSSNGTQSCFSTPQIPRRLPSGPTKRFRRSTLQTTVYTEHLGETDVPPQIERVCLSDSSSDEYQNSRRSDETELDTEPDPKDKDIRDDDIAPGALRHSQTVER